MSVLYGHNIRSNIDGYVELIVEIISFSYYYCFSITYFEIHVLCLYIFYRTECKKWCKATYIGDVTRNIWPFTCFNCCHSLSKLLCSMCKQLYRVPPLSCYGSHYGLTAWLVFLCTSFYHNTSCIFCLHFCSQPFFTLTFRLHSANSVHALILAI